MRLYSGSTQQFVRDSIQNQVAEKLKSAFFSYYRYNPSPNEVNSWRNSLRAMAQVVQHAELNKRGVLLEYQLPQSSKRLDCMLTGQNRQGQDAAIIVELKQWEKCQPSNGDNEVATWVGGAIRDVLICDESHRIRKTSNNRFTKKDQQSKLPQIEELMKVAKVGVYFIDDDQVVRPDEIGSTAVIKEQAQSQGCEVLEFELEAQFRCSGSDAFANWVNNTLCIRQTANVIWTGDEEFDFQVFPSPQALDAAIRQKAQEGFSARVTAGFCWPWSKPRHDGSLVDDIEIGEFKRPWNAKPDAGRLAIGIPTASLWAHEPTGLDQVGCIYTAQGFEFDYVGVIWGMDLKYLFDEMQWTGDKSVSYDTVVKRSKDQFIDLVKNTYRVLLTRGMKGCYVCFLDKDTERFVKSRTEPRQAPIQYLKVAEEQPDYKP